MNAELPGNGIGGVPLVAKLNHPSGVLAMQGSQTYESFAGNRRFLAAWNPRLTDGSVADLLRLAPHVLVIDGTSITPSGTAMLQAHVWPRLPRIKHDP